MNLTSLRTVIRGLSGGEDHVISAGIVESQYQHVTDGRRDGYISAA